MDKNQIEAKIKYLKEHIPHIRNKQTKLQQLKYLHRLQKELNFYKLNYKR